jgi:catechol 2,3-dioxygenase-like lactoylglutathione lyase family enzyme
MSPLESGEPPVSGVHHIGIIVADLEATLAFATELLGLEIEKRVSLPAEGTEIVFLHCGEVLLELIEISDPEARERRARIPAAKAEIEHIALAVPDLDAVVAGLAEEGVQFTAGAGKVETTLEPLEVAGTRSLFTSRRTAAGILVQLIEEVGAASRPPAG